MSEMWMVSQGSYSDYHVVAVFTTEAKARDYLDANVDHRSYSDEMRVETVEVDPEAPAAQGGLYGFKVQMWTNGERATAEQVSSRLILDKHRWDVDQKYQTKTIILEFWVLARDEQHAIKIANERRIQRMVTEPWPPPHDGKQHVTNWNAIDDEREAAARECP